VLNPRYVTARVDQRDTLTLNRNPDHCCDHHWRRPERAQGPSLRLAHVNDPTQEARREVADTLDARR